MANTDVTVNEQDLSEVLRGKVNETVTLQVQVAALTRTVTELTRTATEKAKKMEELQDEYARIVLEVDSKSVQMEELDRELDNLRGRLD
tara:strand:+ start:838 stop:1104 length:267 start_codon:yes stop_codon:yes gene_type:complete